MAFGVNLDSLPEESDGGFERETIPIPEGNNVCRLVSYVEMGHFPPIFKGEHQKYDKGKNTGKPKTDELVIHMVFEFPIAEHSADYPQVIKFSIPFKDREFLNKLSVHKSLEEGWVDQRTAVKMNFVKALTAMRAAVGDPNKNMHEMVGEPFMCTVTHRLGTKQDEKTGEFPVFSNMSLLSLTAPMLEHPLTKAVEVVDVPEATGDYCPVFAWDAPTLEGWAQLQKNVQKAILKASDYHGSPLEELVMKLAQNVSSEGTADKSAPKSPPASNTPAQGEADDIPV